LESLRQEWVAVSNGYTGEIKNTYTILTTEANPLKSEIHNHKKRMPIILNPEDEYKWLNQESINFFDFAYTALFVATKITTAEEPWLLFWVYVFRAIPADL
jgi:putative SOS response-associated peptidase YedK